MVFNVERGKLPDWVDYFRNLTARSGSPCLVVSHPSGDFTEREYWGHLSESLISPVERHTIGGAVIQMGQDKDTKGTTKNPDGTVANWVKATLAYHFEDPSIVKIGGRERSVGECIYLFRDVEPGAPDFVSSKPEAPTPEPETPKPKRKSQPKVPVSEMSETSRRSKIVYAMIKWTGKRKKSRPCKGAPWVKPLRKLLGFRVTREERNEIWKKEFE